MGKFENAETVLSEGLSRHPEDPGLLNAMVFFTLQQGRMRETLDYARRLQRVAPGDPQVRSLIRDLEQRLN
ncbi:tetratricopeptide repeat protein [Marinobacter sp. F4216]|uniref:tetratricopeptide repeat protein n=1 Tax=Marinobacter sp. F4216 TaxID=2874281 RepID=UPI001CBC6B51|nr:tetratricopeptide repeat protein [Marinobacter sp. F4216]MBZ2169824.1 tetratricopeptide repeat protein [Marinobacter sp. F4216]